ncbi:pancreatic triacylglycerol lipase-like [Planococcus citri]|uniref:pancreatic triacylglycerol lipase-like n=1 Tax=Planococcus citri TaxID=170843 RepID=UPI0031F97132
MIWWYLPKLGIICITILSQEINGQIFNPSSQNEFNGVCYDRIGCFSQDSPWVAILRPFPPPWSPEQINVTVYLMTRMNQNLIPIDPFTMDSSLLRYLDFNPFRSITAFIIHGFTASIESSWMTEMAMAYLSRIDANIFLVDWGGGAKNANYLQVAANTRVVGVIMSRFLNYLVYYEGVDPDSVHIIGHSLGAHIAGYMGKNVPGIYRITALDAAQIGFEGADPQVRLMKGDASFVDTYHTNGKPTVPTFGLGFVTDFGDVDFYINGGVHQPSCAADSVQVFQQFPTPLTIARLPVELITELLSCSHSKSIEYFIEAIENPNCVMWGRKRGLVSAVFNIVTFGQLQPLLGNLVPSCSLENCSPMGLETSLYPARGKFYVTTNLVPQYCKNDPSTTEYMTSQLAQTS